MQLDRNLNKVVIRIKLIIFDSSHSTHSDECSIVIESGAPIGIPPYSVIINNNIV